MLVRLMNKEVIAADLHLDVHIGGNNVYNVVIHKKELLPEPLKAAADNANTPEGFLDACFEVWLKERAIPDSRYNLDEALLQLYQLDPSRFGRMQGFQHLGALVCHYMSMEDDYWVTPIKNECASYIYEEPAFNRVYIVHPTSYAHLLYLKKHPDTDTGRVLAGEKIAVENLDGLDFTIKSACPGRWSRSSLGNTFSQRLL